MNKKGFTTIELITSFSIASVIMLVLFNVIIIMKDNMSDINTKTNMLVAKDNLSYNINKRLKEKELTSLSMCEDGDKCYLFTYSDSTTDKLVYNTDSITFNNYTFEITDGITVDAPTITEHYDTMTSTTYNGYIIINIPITINNKDYSIKTVKHINSENVYVNLDEYVQDLEGNQYTIVEYIESTGEQYIDTGYISNQNTGFEIEFLTKNDISSSTYGCIFGSRQSSGSKEYQLSTFTHDSKKGVFRINDQTYDAGIIKNTKMHISYLNNTYNNNNYNLKTSIISNEFESPNSLTIFALNNNNSVTQYGSIKLYNFKIYDNNELIRNFIPVIDDENIPCLFDKVEKKCYYNNGTGVFSFKKKEKMQNYDFKDDLSNYYIIQNYIESTGTQYINTGYIPNQDTEFKIDFITKNDISSGTYGCIFGSRQYSGIKEYQLSTFTSDSKKGIFRINNQTYDAGITKNTKMHISYLSNIYSNNSDLETSIISNEFESPSSLTVFALNNNNSVIQYGSLQLYSFKIYDHNTLVRDFVPVLNIGTNVACLFDKKENKCYYNQGTGDDFLYG